jgi:hypothetical protein
VVHNMALQLQIIRIIKLNQIMNSVTDIWMLKILPIKLCEAGEVQHEPLHAKPIQTPFAEIKTQFHYSMHCMFSLYNTLILSIY